MKSRIHEVREKQSRQRFIVYNFQCLSFVGTGMTQISLSVFDDKNADYSLSINAWLVSYLNFDLDEGRYNYYYFPVTFTPFLLFKNSYLFNFTVAFHS